MYICSKTLVLRGVSFPIIGWLWGLVLFKLPSLKLHVLECDIWLFQSSDSSVPFMTWYTFHAGVWFLVQSQWQNSSPVCCWGWSWWDSGLPTPVHKSADWSERTTRGGEGRKCKIVQTYAQFSCGGFTTKDNLIYQLAYITVWWDVWYQAQMKPLHDTYVRTSAVETSVKLLYWEIFKGQNSSKLVFAEQIFWRLPYI